MSRLAARTGTDRPAAASERFVAMPTKTTIRVPTSMTNRPDDFCTDLRDRRAPR
jgi:hypothetical protein